MAPYGPLYSLTPLEISLLIEERSTATILLAVQTVDWSATDNFLLTSVFFWFIPNTVLFIHFFESCALSYNRNRTCARSFSFTNSLLDGLSRCPSQFLVLICKDDALHYRLRSNPAHSNVPQWVKRSKLESSVVISTTN